MRLTNKVSEEKLKVLNQILTNENFDEITRKIAFSIGMYILENPSSWIYYSDTLLETYGKIFESDKVINNEYFSLLLFNIWEYIQKLSPSNKKIKKEENEEREEKIIFICKIYTIMNILPILVDKKPKEHIDIINNILNSNSKSRNYEFINETFDYERKNNNKTDISSNYDILINTILTHEATDPGNGWRVSKHGIKVIYDKDLYQMDKITYAKAVELLIYGLNPYGLDKAFESKQLTIKKKAAIINYYYKVFPKYLQKYLWIGEGNAKAELNNIIFSIVYNERLLKLTDEEYQQELERISNSDKPFSYATIATSELLTEDKKKFVYKLLAKGKVIKNKYIDYPKSDYKIHVAKTAISKILVDYPYEEYCKLIKKIDEYAQKTEDLQLKDTNEYSQNYWNLNYISTLFNNEYLYANNLPRLLYAVEETVLTNRRVFEFVNHNNSIYYNDEEFKAIIELINNTNTTILRKILIELFTNNYLPFMEDKSILFAIADSSIENIETSINKFNEEGTYQYNLNKIFSGVENNIKKLYQNNHTLKKSLKK